MSKRGPYIRDESGSSYGSRRSHTHKIAKGKTIVMRCDDCGTSRVVAPIETHRAAQPRCLACGGHLSICQAELDRTRDKRVPLVRMNGVKCKACGKKFLESTDLDRHLQDVNSDCAEEYRREGYTR